MPRTELVLRPAIDAAWPAKGQARWLRDAILVIAGSLLLWLSAKIQVPFYPVPMTMQTYVVLIIGALYGWRLGAATLVLYLVEGAFGLPVFAGTPAKGIGLAYMMGPTGGYLAGYLAAAALAGWLVAGSRSPLRVVAALFVADALVFALGAAWLAAGIGWEKAIAGGVTPFLLGDALKIALAAATVLGARRIGQRAK